MDSQAVNQEKYASLEFLSDSTKAFISNKNSCVRSSEKVGITSAPFLL
jgi:hypothetical protein